MTEIKIKDLRGVGDVELQLDDSKRVFVFFGSNGVGKTKTLESLFLFLFYKTTGFKFELEKDNIFNFFKNITYSNKKLKFVDYFFRDSNALFFDYHYLKDLVPYFGYQAIAYLGANERSKILKSSDSHSLNNGLSDRKNNYILSIHNAINDQTLTNFAMNQNIHLWFTERAKSVNPYQKEEDNRKVDIDTVLNALNILDSRIEKTLKIDGDGNVFLTIEGQERELSELSSGFISVVKIIQSIISAYSAFTNATDLLNVKGVVLIDEIESHLHIEWQTKIVPTLKNLFPNTTFYIATHSPLVLSQLDEGEAYLLKRDDDNVVRSSVINSPNTRLLENVLQDAFDVDLNQLKRDNMEHIDQSKAKQKLLALLNR
ncbi:MULTISPECIES: AAA family ATPase [unclassified Moraxella]|uniref:AAA family ATPase n=1 Tax=unclassified Moraxella TaxID=2685852 RepID=UPI003AF4B2F8